MDNSFSSSIDCKETASNSKLILFMLRRSFAELPVSAFAVLYNTLVRPHLEYTMQACSPNPVANAGCLEQIQWLAKRLVKGFHRLPYEERLRRLGLHSLRRRHPRVNLIVVNKMHSAGLDLDHSLFLIPPVWHGLRDHPFKAL